MGRREQWCFPTGPWGHLTRQRKWDWLPHVPRGSGNRAWRPHTPLLSDLAALACPVLCGERGEKTA